MPLPPVSEEPRGGFTNSVEVLYVPCTERLLDDDRVQREWRFALATDSAVTGRGRPTGIDGVLLTRCDLIDKEKRSIVART